MKPIAVPLLFVALLPFIHLDAQEVRHRMMLSYFGETITHPGVSIGHQLIMEEWEKKRTTKKGKVKQKTYQLNVDHRLAMYNHARNHAGLLLSSGISFSRIKSKGTFFRIGIWGGAMQKWLNEDTYEVDADGNIRRIPLAGHLNGVVGLSTQLGKDFSKLNPGSRMGWFIGSNLFLAFPFGTTYLMQNAIELGISYSI
jgi:hypothetical protein